MNIKTLTLSICTATLLFGNSNNIKISFSEVPVPMSDLEKRSIVSSSKITLNGESTNIGFHTILRSGDVIGNSTFGIIYDINGNALKVSHNADFSSLLKVDNSLFMISQFETIPAALYLTKLRQDVNGHLSAISTKNIDLSSINGLWLPCAGSVTPWNTHLGSEEYEPDTKLKADSILMEGYFSGDLSAFNPYNYGWTPEVKILNEQGDVKLVKHYAMGRFSHELSYVMPDKKTVYMSDDGTNVGLFMFKADNPEDLSSGRLYAAKWIQKSSKGAGEATIQWIDLGHSSNNSLEKHIKNKIKFSDIFESSKVKKLGFTSINTRNGQEFLRVQDGMDEIASRLETRRYAAIKGATTEFRKMEGITFDEQNNTLYLAMSLIGKGMENNHSDYDNGGYNHIKLNGNRCGAIYALNMDSNYIATSMKSILEGKEAEESAHNKCSVLGIANPDNLTFIQNTNSLIIGEDTKRGHENDYVWSYSVKDKKLTRIKTAPYGAETTGVYMYNNIGGYGYLMSTVQHPFGDLNTSSKINTQDDFKSYTGYLGPLPVISK